MTYLYCTSSVGAIVYEIFTIVLESKGKKKRQEIIIKELDGVTMELECGMRWKAREGDKWSKDRSTIKRMSPHTCHLLHAHLLVQINQGTVKKMESD